MTRRYAPSLFFVPAFLLVCIAGSANTLAQTGPELLLAPVPEELKLDANAYVGFRDTGHDKATDADFRLDIFETQGRFRLNPGDVASPRIGYSFSYLNIDSSIAGMPEHLVNQSIGFAMPIAQQDGWIVGFSVAAGYAGDSFFGDGDAFYGKAAIGVFKQLSPTDTIAIAIDYNGNRTFRPDLPLPGFAYIKRVDERLLLTLGIPVTSIEWQPIDKLRVQFGYLLVDNVTREWVTRFSAGLKCSGSPRSEAVRSSSTGWTAIRNACSCKSATPKSASLTTASQAISTSRISS